MTDFDDKCDNYDVEDCINENGEVDVDVVAGIFYSKAKTLFREVFEEVLEAQRQKLVKNGLPEDKVEKCRVKIKIKQRKEVPAEKRCHGKIKKTGAQCPNSRKDGYDYCGVHRKGAIARGEVGGTSFEDRVKGTYIVKDEEEKPSVLKLGKPSYQAKDEPELEPLQEIQIDDKMYLKLGHKLYFIPEDYNPDKVPNELDLDLAGTRRRDGGIEWLATPS